MQILSSHQLVGQILGNYRIERFLRQGRLNAIYLARSLTEQRLDALTFYIAPERFSPEARTRFLSRFRKEATAISSLDHPHILSIYDHGEVGGNPYLVTPYMMHGSLVDLLKRHGKYDHSSILPILEQLVSGLAYGHSKGFIHGTLRPSTIVLCPDDALQVAGFGLMHMLQLSGIESNERSDIPHWHLLSIAETFLVTPEYVAPEVIEGQSIDVRSDIYALGCIVFELLSGHSPFTGKDPLDTINKHLTETVPLLHMQNPEVPIAVASVVNQALERNPSRRFQHALELIEAFRQASRGAVSYAASDTKQRRTRVLKQNDFLQDVSHDGYSSNKWQLVPPIVTGKHLAVRLSEQEVVSEMPTQSINTGHWRTVLPNVTGQPPAVTSGKLPSASPPASQKESTSLTSEQEVVSEMPTQSINTGHWRTVLPNVTGQPPAVTSGKLPSASPPVSPGEKTSFAAEKSLTSEMPSTTSSQEMPYLVKKGRQAPAAFGLQSSKATSMPGSNENPSSLAEAYSWWSQPGVASSPQPQAKQTQATRPETSRESLRIADDRDTAKWSDDPSIPYSLPTKTASRKVNRRRAIALLASGGVAAAVGAAAFNLDKLHHLFAPSQAQIQTNTTQTQTQPQNPQQDTGTLVGHTSMALNSANSFTNPADSQGSLLIHLPNNHFVAYEKACTHEQVAVAYNPATKQLVCPAHGAIFDPANNGAVVQGPATRPLASVKISINGDGTITAV